MSQNLYLHTSLMNDQKKKIDRNNKKEVKDIIMYSTLDTGFSLLLSVIINGAVICTFGCFKNV